jgi:hypothetical protein
LPKISQSSAQRAKSAFDSQRLGTKLETSRLRLSRMALW